MRRDRRSGGDGGFSECVGDGLEHFSGAVDDTGSRFAIRLFIEGDFGEAHKLTIDSKFKFQLDGVDQWFHTRLHDINVAELKTDEDHTHSYAEKVDGE